MLDHHTLKAIHLGCVTLSLIGFVLRGGLMLAGSRLLWQRWVRTLPHVVDTLLLISGIWMAVNLRLNPLTTDWLAAKLLALIGYVVLGAIALRRGRTRALRQLALLSALALFAYMVAVARLRTPLPFIG
jgi:uncharacterized membrane protein SirB2